MVKISFSFKRKSFLLCPLTLWKNLWPFEKQTSFQKRENWAANFICDFVPTRGFQLEKNFFPSRNIVFKWFQFPCTKKSEVACAVFSYFAKWHSWNPNKTMKNKTENFSVNRHSKNWLNFGCILAAFARILIAFWLNFGWILAEFWLHFDWILTAF